MEVVSQVEKGLAEIYGGTMTILYNQEFDPTAFIIHWNQRMIKRGWCGCVVCEALACFMNEDGNEKPSIEACKKAVEWEKDDKEMIDFIKAEKKWCAKPTLGCKRYCGLWKLTLWKENK